MIYSLGYQPLRLENSDMGVNCQLSTYPGSCSSQGTLTMFLTTTAPAQEALKSPPMLLEMPHPHVNVPGIVLSMPFVLSL